MNHLQLIRTEIPEGTIRVSLLATLSKEMNPFQLEKAIEKAIDDPESARSTFKLNPTRFNNSATEGVLIESIIPPAGHIGDTRVILKLIIWYQAAETIADDDSLWAMFSNSRNKVNDQSWISFNPKMITEYIILDVAEEDEDDEDYDGEYEDDDDDLGLDDDDELQDDELDDIDFEEEMMNQEGEPNVIRPANASHI